MIRYTVDNHSWPLGKPKAVRKVTTAALGDFLDYASNWPAVKPQGWEYAVPSSQLDVLGNDMWGNCAEAGAMHFIQVETANTGNPLHGTLEQTLRLYKLLTGFDPNAGPPGNNPTDQGTVLIDLLDYWAKNGIEVTDTNGATVIHKIRAYAALDVSSVSQMRYALAMFGGLYWGIECPQSALENMQDWPYVPNSPIAGGHCINAAGEGSVGNHIQSWGKNIPSPWDFALHYLDEAYALLSETWIETQSGKTPSGLDLQALLNAFDSLRIATVLTPGSQVTFPPKNVNAGMPTLNVNARGAKRMR